MSTNLDGVRTNRSMVEPSEINLCSTNGPPTRTEPGFSFEVPPEQREKLTRIFIEGCQAKSQDHITLTGTGDSVKKEDKANQTKRFSRSILHLFHKRAKE